MSRVMSVTEEKNSNSSFLPWISLKVSTGLSAFKFEVDYDQMAMDLPPVTSVAFLITQIFW
jgi:hypothetical protein